MSDDFGFFTGGQGDSNHDGKVSFTEYDNHMDDFKRIYRKNGTPTSSGRYNSNKPIDSGNSVPIPKWVWVFVAIGCLSACIAFLPFGLILTAFCVYGFINRAK